MIKLPIILFLFCALSNNTPSYSQAIVEFKLDGKSYRQNSSSAFLVKNKENLYGLTIQSNDGSNSTIRFYLEDKMSAMPRVHRSDPPMNVGVNYKPARGLFEVDADFSFPDNSTQYSSSEKYVTDFLVNLATLSEKFKTVSGTFEGFVIQVINGEVAGKPIPVKGRFTDVPLR
jgi:hypothetical protein